MRLVVRRGEEIDGKLSGEFGVWLRREDALRGRVTVERGAVGPDTMGGEWIQALTVAGSAGVTSAAARVAVAWLKNQKSDVTLTVRDPATGKETIFQGGVTDVDAFMRRFAEVVESGSAGPGDETP